MDKVVGKDSTPADDKMPESNEPNSNMSSDNMAGMKTGDKKPMMMWAIIVIIVLVLGGIGGWYWASHRTKPVVKHTYKVGYLAVDQLAPALNTAMKNGIALAKKDFETEAVAVEIVAKETSCDGEAAAKAMKELVAEGVVAVVGELCSDATLAAAPIANEKNIPLVSPASTSPKVTDAGDYVFRTIPSDAIYTENAAKIMHDKHKVTKLAVIHTSDTYGNGTAEGLAAAMKALGGSVVVDKSFELTATDMTTEVTAVKNSDANGLFIAGTVSDDTVLLKRQALGMTLPTFGPEYFREDDTLKSAGTSAEGMFVIAVSGGTKAFAEEYQGAYQAAPPSYAAQAYDALAAIMKGLQAGATTGPTLKDQLYKVSFNGVSGMIKFDKNGDVAEGNYQEFTIKDGKPLLVQ